MAKAAMQWAAGCTAGIVMFVLGAGCSGGLSVQEYVSRVFDIQCERIYACCTLTEQRALSIGEGQSGCREALRAGEQHVVDSIEEAVYFQDTNFDGSEAESCLNVLASSSCHDYFLAQTHSCGPFSLPLSSQSQRRPFDGTDTIGLDHFIKECPLSDCIEHTIAPACNGSMVGK
jgi:hypothetical protein